MGCSFASDFGLNGDTGGAVFTALGAASGADFAVTATFADLPAGGAI
jgi:hypothetical protein